MTNANPTTAPHSTSAERTVLGAVLVDTDRMLDIAPILADADFYDPTLAGIYRAMLKLSEDRAPIDVVTVAAALEPNSQAAALGTPFLMELANDVPTASNAKHYAEIIREKSIRRQLAASAGRIAALATEEGESATELLEAAERSLLQLSRTTAANKPVAMRALADERHAHYAALAEADDPTAFYGITTGYGDLDELLTGLHSGELMVIAGRPSMGKTAMALDSARHATAKLEKTVAILSLEMSKEQLFDRMFAAALGISTLGTQTWRLE